MEPQNKPAASSNATAIGITLAVIVIVAVVLISTMSGKNTAAQAPATDQTSSDPSTAPAAGSVPSPAPAGSVSASTASAYKDGTYSATGTYMSPGGQDHVGVSLTLANDLITDITVTPEPGDFRTSARYQAMFVSGYKQYVLGKDISTVDLTKVSGSSLTPKGFDDAIAQIKAEAQA